MYFKLTNPYQLNADYIKYTTKLTALKVISMYNFKSTENKLNKYLWQQHKISLRDLCIKIIYNLTFSKDYTGEVVATFSDRNLEKLAQLITYGNGKLFGSRILKDALS